MTNDQSNAMIEDWLQILDSSNYYELLGILEIADESAIQAAFHEFSKSFHPDRHRGGDLLLRGKVTQIYRRGAEAYGVLRDSRLRMSYDLGLAQGALRLTKKKNNSEKTGGAESLESLCSTAGGKMHARKVQRALGEQNLDEAHRQFRSALMAEGNNTNLEGRFKQLLELASHHP